MRGLEFKCVFEFMFADKICCVDECVMPSFFSQEEPDKEAKAQPRSSQLSFTKTLNTLLFIREISYLTSHMMSLLGSLQKCRCLIINSSIRHKHRDKVAGERKMRESEHERESLWRKKGMERKRKTCTRIKKMRTKFVK